jgi:hypothetical protein
MEFTTRAAEIGKCCRACKRVKPPTEFSSHRLAKDGHRHDCKSCVKVGHAKTKAKTKAQIAKLMEQATQPQRRIANRVAVKAWKQRNPQAVHARTVLARAVRKGKVEREHICQVADCDRATSDAHHHDYSAPLEVVWLCSQHHRRLHHGAHLTLKPSVSPKLARLPKAWKGGKEATAS